MDCFTVRYNLGQVSIIDENSNPVIHYFLLILVRRSNYRPNHRDDSVYNGTYVHPESNKVYDWWIGSLKCLKMTDIVLKPFVMNSWPFSSVLSFEIISYNARASCNTMVRIRSRSPASVTTSTGRPSISVRSIASPPTSSRLRPGSRSMSRSISLSGRASPRATGTKPDGFFNLNPSGFRLTKDPDVPCSSPVSEFKDLLAAFSEDL